MCIAATRRGQFFLEDLLKFIAPHGLGSFGEGTEHGNFAR